VSKRDSRLRNLELVVVGKPPADDGVGSTALPEEMGPLPEDEKLYRCPKACTVQHRC
jgi:hypothetical protein